MIDWTSPMEQSYEFYKVDPVSWADMTLLNNIETASINRDLSDSTLCSATIDTTELMDECYIRIYLVAIQNGVTERVSLGTFLAQTPSIKFDGKNRKLSMDGYSPLIELKGNMPPLGYSLLEGDVIMTVVNALCRDNMRAPVINSLDESTLSSDFVSNINDTWLTFVSDLAYKAKFLLSVDGYGRLSFTPEKDTASLPPVWTYDDGNSSILYPDFSDERDLYGIPNVVEVIYSTDTTYIRSRVVNDDPNSPVSTVTRGREIVRRITDPSVSGVPDQSYIDMYAEQVLRNLSCLEHTVTYKHGYCPVKVGDCVLINYEDAGLTNVKAKVISQTISCETGCPVEETATYTTKLWR